MIDHHVKELATMVRTPNQKNQVQNMAKTEVVIIMGYCTQEDRVYEKIQLWEQMVRTLTSLSFQVMKTSKKASIKTRLEIKVSEMKAMLMEMERSSDLVLDLMDRSTNPSSGVSYSIRIIENI